MSKNEKSYSIYTKNAAIIIIVTLTICIACLLLGNVQMIANFSFRLHEMFFLPINIGLFLIPLEVVFFLYFITRWILEKKQKTDIKRNVIISLFAVILLISYCSYFLYLSYEVQTSGICIIRDKFSKDNNYYVIINDKELKCTQNEFNLISEGKEYLVSYCWNKINQGKGKLEYIKETEKK